MEVLHIQSGLMDQSKALSNVSSGSWLKERFTEKSNLESLNLNAHADFDSLDSITTAGFTLETDAFTDGTSNAHTDFESFLSTNAIKVRSNAGISASITSEDGKGLFGKSSESEYIADTRDEEHKNNYHSELDDENMSKISSNTKSGREIIGKLNVLSTGITIPSNVPDSTKSSVLQTVISDFISREKVLRNIRNKYSRKSLRELLDQRNNDMPKIPSFVTFVTPYLNMLQIDTKPLSLSQEKAGPLPPEKRTRNTSTKTPSEIAGQRLYEEGRKRQQRLTTKSTLSRENKYNFKFSPDTRNTNELGKKIEKLNSSTAEDVFHRLYNYKRLGSGEKTSDLTDDEEEVVDEMEEQESSRRLKQKNHNNKRNHLVSRTSKKLCKNKKSYTETSQAFVTKSPLAETSAELIDTHSYLLRHGITKCRSISQRRFKELNHNRTEVDGKLLRSIKHLIHIKNQSIHNHVCSPVSYQSRFDKAVKRNFGMEEPQRKLIPFKRIHNTHS